MKTLRAYSREAGFIQFIALIAIVIVAVAIPVTVKFTQGRDVVGDIRNFASIKKPPSRACVYSDCGCESGFSCKGTYPSCECKSDAPPPSPPPPPPPPTEAPKPPALPPDERPPVTRECGFFDGVDWGRCDDKPGYRAWCGGQGRCNYEQIVEQPPPPPPPPPPAQPTPTPTPRQIRDPDNPYIDYGTGLPVPPTPTPEPTTPPQQPPAPNTTGSIAPPSVVQGAACFVLCLARGGADCQGECFGPQPTSIPSPEPTAPPVPPAPTKPTTPSTPPSTTQPGATSRTISQTTPIAPTAPPKAGTATKPVIVAVPSTVPDECFGSAPCEAGKQEWGTCKLAGGSDFACLDRAKNSYEIINKKILAAEAQGDQNAIRMRADIELVNTLRDQMKQPGSTLLATWQAKGVKLDTLGRNDPNFLAFAASSQYDPKKYFDLAHREADAARFGCEAYNKTVGTTRIDCGALANEKSLEVEKNACVDPKSDVCKAIQLAKGKTPAEIAKLIADAQQPVAPKTIATPAQTRARDSFTITEVELADAVTTYFRNPKKLDKRQQELIAALKKKEVPGIDFNTLYFDDQKGLFSITKYWNGSTDIELFVDKKKPAAQLTTISGIKIDTPTSGAVNLSQLYRDKVLDRIGTLISCQVTGGCLNPENTGVSGFTELAQYLGAENQKALATLSQMNPLSNQTKKIPITIGNEKLEMVITFGKSKNGVSDYYKISIGNKVYGTGTGVTPAWGNTTVPNVATAVATDLCSRLAALGQETTKCIADQKKLLTDAKFFSSGKELLLGAAPAAEEKKIIADSCKGDKTCIDNIKNTLDHGLAVDLKTKTTYVPPAAVVKSCSLSQYSGAYIQFKDDPNIYACGSGARLEKEEVINRTAVDIAGAMCAEEEKRFLGSCRTGAVVGVKQSIDFLIRDGKSPIEIANTTAQALKETKGVGRVLEPLQVLELEKKIAEAKKVEEDQIQRNIAELYSQYRDNNDKRTLTNDEVKKIQDEAWKRIEKNYRNLGQGELQYERIRKGEVLATDLEKDWNKITENPLFGFWTTVNDISGGALARLTQNDEVTHLRVDGILASQSEAERLRNLDAVEKSSIYRDWKRGKSNPNPEDFQKEQVTLLVGREVDLRDAGVIRDDTFGSILSQTLRGEIDTAQVSKNIAKLNFLEMQLTKAYRTVATLPFGIGVGISGSSPAKAAETNFAADRIYRDIEYFNPIQAAALTKTNGSRDAVIAQLSKAIEMEDKAASGDLVSKEVSAVVSADPGWLRNGILSGKVDISKLNEKPLTVDRMVQAYSDSLPEEKRRILEDGRKNELAYKQWKNNPDNVNKTDQEFLVEQFIAMSSVRDDVANILSAKGEGINAKNIFAGKMDFVQVKKDIDNYNPVERIALGVNNYTNGSLLQGQQLRDHAREVLANPLASEEEKKIARIDFDRGTIMMIAKPVTTVLMLIPGAQAIQLANAGVKLLSVPVVLNVGGAAAGLYFTGDSLQQASQACAFGHEMDGGECARSVAMTAFAGLSSVQSIRQANLFVRQAQVAKEVAALGAVSDTSKVGEGVNKVSEAFKASFEKPGRLDTINHYLGPAAFSANAIAVCSQESISSANCQLSLGMAVVSLARLTQPRQAALNPNTRAVEYIQKADTTVNFAQAAAACAAVAAGAAPGDQCFSALGAASLSVGALRRPGSGEQKSAVGSRVALEKAVAEGNRLSLQAAIIETGKADAQAHALARELAVKPENQTQVEKAFDKAQKSWRSIFDSPETLVTAEKIDAARMALFAADSAMRQETDLRTNPRNTVNRFLDRATGDSDAQNFERLKNRFENIAKNPNPESISYKQAFDELATAREKLASRDWTKSQHEVMAELKPLTEEQKKIEAEYQKLAKDIEANKGDTRKFMELMNQQAEIVARLEASGNKIAGLEKEFSQSGGVRRRFAELVVGTDRNPSGLGKLGTPLAKSMFVAADAIGDGIGRIIPQIHGPPVELTADAKPMVELLAKQSRERGTTALETGKNNAEPLLKPTTEDVKVQRNGVEVSEHRTRIELTDAGKNAGLTEQHKGKLQEILRDFENWQADQKPGEFQKITADPGALLDQANFVIGAIEKFGTKGARGTIFGALPGLGKTDIVIPLNVLVQAHLTNDSQFIVLPDSTIRNQFVRSNQALVTFYEKQFGSGSVVVLGGPGERQPSPEVLRKAKIVIAMREVAFELRNTDTPFGSAVRGKWKASFVHSDETHWTFNPSENYQQTYGKQQKIIETAEGKGYLEAKDKVIRLRSVAELIEAKSQGHSVNDVRTNADGTGAYSAEREVKILKEWLTSYGDQLPGELKLLIGETDITKLQTKINEYLDTHLDAALGAMGKELTVINKLSDVLGNVQGLAYGLDSASAAPAVAPREQGKITGRRYQGIVDQILYNTVGADILDVKVDLGNLTRSEKSNDITFARLLFEPKGQAHYTGTPELVAKLFEQAYGVTLQQFTGPAYTLVKQRLADNSAKVVASLADPVAKGPGDKNIVYLNADNTRSNDITRNEIAKLHPGKKMFVVGGNGEFIEGIIDAKGVFAETKRYANRDELNARTKELDGANERYIKLYEYGAHTGVDTFNDVNLTHGIAIVGDIDATTFSQLVNRLRPQRSSGEYPSVDIVFSGGNLDVLDRFLTKNEMQNLKRGEILFKESLLRNSADILIDELEATTKKPELIEKLESIREQWKEVKDLAYRLGSGDMTAEAKLARTLEQVKGIYGTIEAAVAKDARVAVRFEQLARGWKNQKIEFTSGSEGLHNLGKVPKLADVVQLINVSSGKARLADLTFSDRGASRQVITEATAKAAKITDGIADIDTFARDNKVSADDTYGKALFEIQQKTQTRPLIERYQREVDANYARNLADKNQNIAEAKILTRQQIVGIGQALIANATLSDQEKTVIYAETEAYAARKYGLEPPRVFVIDHPETHEKIIAVQQTIDGEAMYLFFQSGEGLSALAVDRVAAAQEQQPPSTQGVDLTVPAEAVPVEPVQQPEKPGAPLTTAPLNGPQCVIGSTKLKRRKKRRDGTWSDEFEDVPIKNIVPGDEILSLNETTGKLVPAVVEKLLDKGVQTVYKLTTKSGKSITTTSEHPYLVLDQKHNEIDFILNHTFAEGKQLARWYYFGFLDKTSIRVPALGGEKVYFTREGWEHILAEKRSTHELLTRLFALTRVSAVLEHTHRIVDHDTRLLVDRSFDVIEYWVFEEVVEGVLVKVVVASYEYGPKFFLSAIWKGTKHAKGIKKELSLACNPRRRRMVTSQLFNRESIAQNLPLSSTHGQWVKVKDLRSGQRIATVEGWETIAAIREAGRKHVYDVQIAGTHNFIGNGIVAHNTSIPSTVEVAMDEGLVIAKDDKDNVIAVIPQEENPDASLFEKYRAIGPNYRNAIRRWGRPVAARKGELVTALGREYRFVENEHGKLIIVTASVLPAPISEAIKIKAETYGQLSLITQYSWVGLKGMNKVPKWVFPLFAISRSDKSPLFPASLFEPAEQPNPPPVTTLLDDALAFIRSGREEWRAGSVDAIRGKILTSDVVREAMGKLDADGQNQVRAAAVAEAQKIYNTVAEEDTMAFWFERVLELSNKFKPNPIVGVTPAAGGLDVLDILREAMQIATFSKSIDAPDELTADGQTFQKQEEMEIGTQEQAKSFIPDWFQSGQGVRYRYQNNALTIIEKSEYSANRDYLAGQLTLTQQIGTAIVIRAPDGKSVAFLRTSPTSWARYEVRIQPPAPAPAEAPAAPAEPVAESPAPPTQKSSATLPECVTGDTKLRRRRRKLKTQNSKLKTGGWDPEEFEDVAIKDIELGDEILTLDEYTGKFVPSIVEKLMKKGRQEVFELITESGKTIRTTANHPYLVDFTERRSDTNFLYDQSYQATEELAESFYANVLEGNYIKAPALDKEKIYFSREGWNHTFTGRASKLEVISRFFALPKVLFVLGFATSPVEAKPRILFKQDMMIKYWALQGIVDGAWVRVVIRSVNDGPKYFYSVVWKGEDHAKEVQNAIKKGAVSRLYPRIQASGKPIAFSTSLWKDYTTFIDNVSRTQKELSLTVSGRWVKVKDLRVGQRIATVDGWETIVSIKKAGRKHVYDVQIAGTHNFVGNGIVAHNTTVKPVGLIPFGAGIGWGDVAREGIRALSGMIYIGNPGTGGFPIGLIAVPIIDGISRVMNDNGISTPRDLWNFAKAYVHEFDIRNQSSGIVVPGSSRKSEPEQFRRFGDLPQAVENATFLWHQTQTGDLAPLYQRLIQGDVVGYFSEVMKLVGQGIDYAQADLVPLLQRLTRQEQAAKPVMEKFAERLRTAAEKIEQEGCAGVGAGALPRFAFSFGAGSSHKENNNSHKHDGNNSQKVDNAKRHSIYDSTLSLVPKAYAAGGIPVGGRSAGCAIANAVGGILEAGADFSEKNLWRMPWGVLGKAWSRGAGTSGTAPPARPAIPSGVLIPTRDTSPDRNKLRLWVAAHDPIVQPLVQLLAQKIRYIPFTEFYESLAASVSDFKTKIGKEPYAVFLPYVDSEFKSEFWTYQLVKNQLPGNPELVKPLEEEIFFANHPNIKHFLVLDDASYGGLQLTRPIDILGRAAEKFGKKDIIIHIATPYVSKAAEKQVNKALGRVNNAVAVDWSPHKSIETISEILGQSNLGSELLSQEMQEMLGLTDTMSVTIFQHKIPDRGSFPDSLRRGKVELKDGIKFFKVFPLTVPPYKTPPLADVDIREIGEAIGSEIERLQEVLVKGQFPYTDNRREDVIRNYQAVRDYVEGTSESVASISFEGHLRDLIVGIDALAKKIGFTLSPRYYESLKKIESKLPDMPNESTKKSAPADLGTSGTSRNDWPLKLKEIIARLFSFVNRGVDLPGVAPGRLGLRDQSSERARPTPLSSIAETNRDLVVRIRKTGSIALLKWIVDTNLQKAEKDDLALLIAKTALEEEISFISKIKQGCGIALVPKAYAAVGAIGTRVVNSGIVCAIVASVVELVQTASAFIGDIGDLTPERVWSERFLPWLTCWVKRDDERDECRRSQTRMEDYAIRVGDTVPVVLEPLPPDDAPTPKPAKFDASSPLTADLRKQLLLLFAKKYPAAKLDAVTNATLFELSEALGIPLEILLAQIMQESQFRPTVESGGTWGLMQVYDGSAKDARREYTKYIAKVTNMNTKNALAKIVGNESYVTAYKYDPVLNYTLGTFYLAWAKNAVSDQKYPDANSNTKLLLALARYNKGDLAEVALDLCYKPGNLCSGKKQETIGWYEINAYLDRAAIAKGYMTPAESVIMKDKESNCLDEAKQKKVKEKAAYPCFVRLYINNITSRSIEYTHAMNEYANGKIDEKTLKDRLFK